MEDLQCSLGKFYFAEYTNAPPTLLQVVGWTLKAEKEDTKRRYVYIRKVPVLLNHSPNGGSWEFDHDVIQRYKKDIKEPQRSSKNPIVDGNAVMIPGGFMLRYQGKTLNVLRV